MAEITFNQTFNGYWLEPNKVDLPKSPGIYCVYECTYNKFKDTVSIQKLIYIGESDNVNSRVSNHQKQKDWEKNIRTGNQICYSFSPVGADNRLRVEAAFIFRHKPVVNIEYENNFPFEKTIIKCDGKSRLLDKYFVVNKTVDL